MAEHSGQDLHVALVVVYPGRDAGTVHQPVSLRQIAPTILHALGLHQRALAAVRLEKTRLLPGLGDSDDDDDGDHGDN